MFRQSCHAMFSQNERANEGKREYIGEKWWREWTTPACHQKHDEFACGKHCARNWKLCFTTQFTEKEKERKYISFDMYIGSCVMSSHTCCRISYFKFSYKHELDLCVNSCSIEKCSECKFLIGLDVHLSVAMSFCFCPAETLFYATNLALFFFFLFFFGKRWVMRNWFSCYLALICVLKNDWIEFSALRNGGAEEQ